MSLNIARRVALLAGASAIVTSIASAQSAAAYAPGRLRYHVTTESTRSQPLGGGRAPFDFTTTTNQWIALDVAPQSSDTLKVAMTVDSIRISSTLDAPAPDVSVLQGAKFTGTMSPRGRIYTLVPAGASTDGKLVATATALKRFLMPLPSRSLAAGASWADTVVEHPKVGTINITSSSVTTYKVAGDTTVSGQHAWRIDRYTTIAQLGKGVEAGQPLEISSSGTVTGMQFFTDKGVLLGGQSTQRTDLMEKMNESEGAPIRQTFKSTVELLPSGG
ncbi:MAG: hypothetical protein JJD97_03190 [Gemmatimonadaceae bacterium]|nr:hypothetical protein [Gemmatimonadaceae bacterium]